MRCFSQHLVLAVAAYALYRFFYWTKEGLPAGHQINRSWADASMVFLFLTLLVGPLARLWPNCRMLIPWRRDFGLWFAITAVVHIGLLAELRNWDVLRFFVNDEGELLKAAAHGTSKRTTAQENNRRRQGPSHARIQFRSGRRSGAGD